MFGRRVGPIKTGALIVVATLAAVGCAATIQPQRSSTSKGASGAPIKVFAGWRGFSDLPYHSWNSSEAQPTGFEPALIERVARLIGRSVAYVSIGE